MTEKELTKEQKEIRDKYLKEGIAVRVIENNFDNDSVKFDKKFMEFSGMKKGDIVTLKGIDRLIQVLDDKNARQLNDYESQQFDELMKEKNRLTVMNLKLSGFFVLDNEEDYPAIAISKDNIDKLCKYHKPHVLLRKYIQLLCEFKNCNKKLGTLYFKCPYCDKIHCETHRLPENHECPNPTLPYEMRKGFGTKPSSLFK